MSLRAVGLLSIAVVVGACSGAGSPSASHAPSDELGALVSDLRSRGATVAVEGTVSEPFFSASGRLLVVNGKEVQVLRFQSADESSVAAHAVSPDGYSVGASTGGLTTVSQIDWIATPHYYRRGSLIVLYVGQDGPMRQLLQAALGAPFAGGA